MSVPSCWWAGDRGGVSPTGFRACRFLPADGRGIGEGSAPLASAHVGSFLLVGGGSGRDQPHWLPRIRCSFQLVAARRYAGRLYTTDLRLTCLERQSVCNVV